MTKPPDRTICELVNDLYRRLDIASRPRCAEAKLLEQIGLAADALQAGTDDPRVAALEADRAAVVAYARKLERIYISEFKGVYDVEQEMLDEKRAEAGVQRIMEARDGE